MLSLCLSFCGQYFLMQCKFPSVSRVENTQIYSLLCYYGAAWLLGPMGQHRNGVENLERLKTNTVSMPLFSVFHLKFRTRRNF